MMMRLSASADKEDLTPLLPNVVLECHDELHGICEMLAAYGNARVVDLHSCWPKGWQCEQIGLLS